MPGGTEAYTDHCRWIRPDLLIVVKKDHRHKLPGLQAQARSSYLAYRVGVADEPLAVGNRWVLDLDDLIGRAWLDCCKAKGIKPEIPLWTSPWSPIDWRDAWEYLRESAASFGGFIDANPPELFESPGKPSVWPRPVSLGSYDVESVRLCVLGPTTGVWVADNAVAHRLQLVVPRSSEAVNPVKERSLWRAGASRPDDIRSWAVAALVRANRSPMYAGPHYLDVKDPTGFRIVSDPVDAFVRRTRAFYPAFAGYPGIAGCENTGCPSSLASGPDAPRIP